MALAQAVMTLTHTHQLRNQTLTSFYDTFRNQMAVIKQQGGNIATHSTIIINMLMADKYTTLADLIKTEQYYLMDKDENIVYLRYKDKAEDSFAAKLLH